MTIKDLNPALKLKRSLAGPLFAILAAVSIALAAVRCFEVYSIYLADTVSPLIIAIAKYLPAGATALRPVNLLGLTLPLLPALLIGFGSCVAFVGGIKGRGGISLSVFGLNLAKIGLLANTVTSFFLVLLGPGALIALFALGSESEMSSESSLILSAIALAITLVGIFRAKYFIAFFKVVDSFTMSARADMPFAHGSRFVSGVNWFFAVVSVIGIFGESGIGIAVLAANALLLILINLWLIRYDLPTAFASEQARADLAESSEKRGTGLGIGLQINPSDPYGPLIYGRRGWLKRSFGISAFSSENDSLPDSPIFKAKRGSRKYDGTPGNDKVKEDPDALFKDGELASFWKERFITSLKRLRNALELFPKVREERNALKAHRIRLDNLLSRLRDPDKYEYRENSSGALAKLAEEASYRKCERIKKQRKLFRFLDVLAFAVSWVLIPIHAAGFICLGATAALFIISELSFSVALSLASPHRLPRSPLMKKEEYLTALAEDKRLEAKKKEEYRTSYERLSSNIRERLETVTSDLGEAEASYSLMKQTTEQYPYLIPSDRNVPFINKLIYSLEWEKLDSVNEAVRFACSPDFYNKFPDYDEKAKKYVPEEYKDVSEIARSCASFESEMEKGINKLIHH